MSLKQTPGGDWVMRYYVDGTALGKRVQERLPYGTTKEQAEELYRLRLDQRREPDLRYRQLQAFRDRHEERTSLLGGAAELWVAADLMAHGFHVFRHMVLQSPCDLILMHGDVLLRVECKMREHGKVRPGIRPNPARFDLLAVVDSRTAKIQYTPEPWVAIEAKGAGLHSAVGT